MKYGWRSLKADDVKLIRKIGNHKNYEELQIDINKIYEWSKAWEMDFNEEKNVMYWKCEKVQ